MPDPPSNSQLLIYRSEDGRITLDVRFEGETVWLALSRNTLIQRTWNVKPET